MKTITEFPDLEAPVREKLEQRRRVSPCHSNRASQIGHPCIRFLYFCRANWEERKLPETTLLYIFGEGNLHEDAIIRRLQDAGWEISQQQRDFATKDGTNITGHIDGFITIIQLNDIYPLEAKSMSSHIWPKINSQEDMKNSVHTWVRGYPAQLNLYMYLANKDAGVFYLKNKATGEGKSIWMTLDYDLAEECLRKAEAVNKALEEKKAPPRIPYNPELCNGCDFEHICLPPGEAREGLLIEHEPVIAELLQRREELEAMSREFDKLDKEIKTYAKKRDAELLNIGDYLIEKKTSTYMSKPTEAKETTRTTIKICRLGAGEEENSE
jgi:CRISPR/Cas system-associated exonuclease Cas4 (RecB family)